MCIASFICLIRYAWVSWAPLHNFGMWMRVLRVAACKTTQSSRFNASYTKATETSPMDLPSPNFLHMLRSPFQCTSYIPLRSSDPFVHSSGGSAQALLLAGGHMPENTGGEHNNVNRVLAMVTAVKTSKPKVWFFLIRRGTITVNLLRELGRDFQQQNENCRTVSRNICPSEDNED